jgi:hypothetical protein
MRRLRQESKKKLRLSELWMRKHKAKPQLVQEKEWIAAVVIQRYARGFLVCEQLELWHIAAAKLQGLFRGHSERCRQQKGREDVHRKKEKLVGVYWSTVST